MYDEITREEVDRIMEDRDTNPSQSTVISVSEVKNLLNSGYTRTKSHKGYNPEIGSVEEYYNLEPAQVRLLFQHEKLKGLRTKVVITPTFTVVD